MKKTVVEISVESFSVFILMYMLLRIKLSLSISQGAIYFYILY